MEKVKKLTKQDWNLLKIAFPETCKGDFDEELYKDCIVFRHKTEKNQKDYAIIVFSQTSLLSWYILFIYVPEKDRGKNVLAFQEKTSNTLMQDCYNYCCNKYINPSDYVSITCSIRYPNISSLKFFLKQKFKVDGLCVYPNGTPGYELVLKILV